MGWARFDDHYSDHPKVADAGPWAELLDMRAIIYCARHETDGHIASGQLQRLGVGIPAVATKARRLVQVGRWHIPGHDCDQCPPISDGYLVHDYLTYNPSSERKDAERAAARERVRRARERKQARRPQVPPREAPDDDGSEDVRANIDRSNGVISPDVRSTPYPARTPEHPPSPPSDDPPPLDPANVNGGGTATPKVNGDDLAARTLQRLIDAMPPDLTADLPSNRQPQILAKVHAALADGWTPTALVDEAMKPGWRAVHNPAGALLARLAAIASREPPTAAIERRHAAEKQRKAERTAELQADEAERRRLDAAIDALPDDDRAALTRQAWEAMPHVVRPPEPDPARPAVRMGMRSLLAERERSSA